MILIGYNRAQLVTVDTSHGNFEETDKMLNNCAATRCCHGMSSKQGLVGKLRGAPRSEERRARSGSSFHFHKRLPIGSDPRDRGRMVPEADFPDGMPTRMVMHAARRYWGGPYHMQVGLRSEE